MGPLVTVAITTYNRTKYLRETLACVLAQDYPRLEIIVSDNGSQDDTQNVIRGCVGDDPRVRCRRNENNLPTYQHFTQCVQEARGEFFILLHDDDRINPQFVSELVAVATRYEDVNVVLPRNVLMDEDAVPLETLALLAGEVFDGPELACNWLHQRRPLFVGCLVTLLARTEVIRRFGGYQDFGPGALNIDNLLFLQCALTGRVGYARDAIFSWRVHKHSYGSTNTLKQVAESARRFMRHLRRDPATRAALASMPATRRKEIVEGVRVMTAYEYLSRLGFAENLFRPVCFRNLFRFPASRTFWHMVLQRYYHNARRRLRARQRWLWAR